MNAQETTKKLKPVKAKIANTKVNGAGMLL
jgi:hypothetical protein